MTTETTGREWTTLSAYVDGELDAATAAAVAQAAGDDPRITADIAMLYRLKGASHDAFAPPQGALDHLTLASILPPKRNPARRWAAVAATILVLAFVASASFAWLRPHPATLPPEILATAQALHADWLRTESAERTDDPPATLVAALAEFRRLPMIPDLASAKLTIDRVRFAEQPSGDILQVGYRGEHGCHLSLFVFSAADLPDAMTRVDMGTERAYGWQVDTIGYVLFAKGMDANRFALIAEEVEKATHSHSLFDNRTREALAESKRKSASCAA